MMCDERLRCKVSDMFEELCRKLSANGEVGTTSQIFSELKTNAERVQFSSELLSKYSLFPRVIHQKKDDELSAKYRQEGNEAFKKKEDLCAWRMYTKSISYAKNNGECLSLAYANRSAVLYEKKMYRECLEDIAAAFANNYPSHLHDKLKRREEKARALLPAQPPFVYHVQASTLDTSNPRIECASAKVTIRDSRALGRHIVATETIQIGEVVTVERPYAHVLLENRLQEHCYWCLKLGYSWKPCENCIYAMFCSNECYKNAWQCSHKYECPILATLYAMEMSKLSLLALRIALVARDDYPEILEGKYDNPAALSLFYKSQRYREIHLLAANTSLRTASDLFSKAVTAAVIRHVVQISSPFRAELAGDYRVFDELLMRHLQTGPTNFHEISEVEDEGEGKGFNPSEVGAGAYAFLSLFNHSCNPNIVRHCHGTEIVARAIRMIHKGEQLFDNYGYHYAVMRKADRKRELERQYFFSCDCEACQNNWPLYANLPQRAKDEEPPPFDVPDLKPLLTGDRDEAIALLTRLPDDNAPIGKTKKFKRCNPSKSAADFQETIKQCYALLGNRKPKF